MATMKPTGPYVAWLNDNRTIANVTPGPSDALTRREPAPAKHLLPPLRYGYAALEPHIDARTMTLHHDKHHASYVEKLNAALEGFPELQGRTASWLLLIWEHAYYLRYEDRRADYLRGWWAVANWEEAARRYEGSDESAGDDWEAEGGRLLVVTP